MAVKEDTDICLNITGNTTNSEKTTAQIVNEMCLKKLNRPSIERVKRPFKKFHAIESSKGLLIGAKKRIKQKSLVTIVSNNLKRANRPTAVPKRSILKKSTAIISHENAKPLSNESSKDLKSLAGKTKSNVQNRKNKCDGTLISFTKNVKDNPIKTILAKKRKRDGDKPSQSLSSIFKVTDSKKVKFLESNDTDSKFTSEQVQKPEMSDSTVSTVSNIKSKPPDGLKKSRVDKSVEKNYKTKADFKRKNTRSRLHQTGNFFSLFKNNPSVPNIGQRLVKPINEEVFSAEKFSDLGIHVFTVLNLEQNMNITTMTTVQKIAIPVILSGSDTLIRSQTGSGKTLSYALPIIENLQSVKPKLTRISGINALVIVPTRELALQTYECFLKLIKPFTWLVPGYLVGGEKRKAEKARLRKGCNILVATPGRLLDHIRHTKALKLDSIKYFVLDEADRMLDMGYEKDISEIVDVLKNTPSESSNLEYDALSMLRQHIKPNADDKNVNENLDNQNKFDNNVVDDMEGMKNENANKQNQYHQLCRNDVEHKNASKVSSNMEYDAISMLRQHAKSNSKTKNVNDNVDSQNKFDNNIGDDTEGMKSKITNKQYQYQFRRNDDQLKNKSKVSNNLEYDALSMLRQHAKSNSKTKNVNENLDNQDKSDNNIEDETEVKKSEISRRQYHSDTDEDSNHESDLVNSKSVLSLDNKRNEDEKIIPDISKSPKRQTILLSATLTHAVEKLAGLTMHNPVFVDAAKDNVEASGGSMNEANEDLIVPQSVVQSYIVTPPKLRMVTLSAYIAGKCRNQGNHKILIFMATQDMIDYHEQILSSILNQPIDDEDEDSDALVGIEFFKLHGNMSQKDRTEVFKIFKQANNGVLLCTLTLKDTGKKFHATKSYEKIANKNER
ncbi:PREDICTED: probable ATP-dependent RNA helicase CG8611 [Ceratosolen solmsi marchali]|uniref:ATP-dependent RNA helicase n=1 Tax=Ceratosolen solmsi marchali TaxID=326594 RepID=A0AAJ6YY62_9HYME|nr:PREDICTED: probable ATP-dependent RNA helicase CG8611 [Ceratosolen solmsi marchali]